MPGKSVALTAAVIVIGTIVTLVLLDGTVTGAILGRVTLPSSGRVKAIGVEVYSDGSCSDPVSSIGWGWVEPGTTKNVVVYIRNEGDAPVALSLGTENWSPPNASDYMNLNWDYGGQLIDVDCVVQVILSLAVSDSVEGITSFSFDIVITGNG